MATPADRLRAVDGADARVIAHLEALDFAVDYVRDDLESQYSKQELAEAYRVIMASQVSGDDFGDLIGREFEAQTLFFEDIVVFVFPSTRYEAIFASFDRDENVPITDLIEVATSTER